MKRVDTTKDISNMIKAWKPCKGGCSCCDNDDCQAGDSACRGCNELFEIVEAIWHELDKRK